MVKCLLLLTVVCILLQLYLFSTTISTQKVNINHILYYIVVSVKILQLVELFFDIQRLLMLKTLLKLLKYTKYLSMFRHNIQFLFDKKLWYNTNSLKYTFGGKQSMEFIRNVDIVDFDDFVKNHPTKSHFMQSAAWGEFSLVQKGLTPHFVGLRDGGELKAAALLLERKPPMFPPYLYSPRGYVIDFFDEALVGEFTRGVEAFAKELDAMFVALDPDVERCAIDGDGVHRGGFDNSRVIDCLKSLGYTHRGFNKEFEGRQPRYTFRIDLTRDDKEIEKGIVGNVMKNVRKSNNYSSVVVHGNSADIPVLHKLISLTSERDEFVGYDENYYQNFFDILNKNGMATLYLGSTYPQKTVDMLKASLAGLVKKRETLKKPGPIAESEATEERIRREIELFSRYAESFPDGATISAHLVVNYGDKSWAVHAGSDKLMSETFLNNRVYFEKLIDQKARGCRLFDQFGTVGDPENSPLRSLHEFKKQFGGRYVEFVGEFDLVTKPFWFFLYEKLLPLYRRARISLKMLLRRAR